MESRILIVDDEPAIRALLGATFQGAGFRVQTAADVPEAMARFAAEPFDVVLTDVRMPGGSGHDLVRWLAAKCPTVRALLMSGCEIDCDQCPFTRQCFVLNKPFLPKQALSAVEKLLSENGAR